MHDKRNQLIKVEYSSLKNGLIQEFDDNKKTLETMKLRQQRAK